MLLLVMASSLFPDRLSDRQLFLLTVNHSSCRSVIVDDTLFIYSVDSLHIGNLVESAGIIGAKRVFFKSLLFSLDSLIVK